MKVGYNRPIGANQEVSLELDLALITSLAGLLGLLGIAAKKLKDQQDDRQKVKVKARRK
tara:strand:+ start:157 stop:333 length:177 start_codon:yes stop_codon:yes gene_type:complete